MLGTIKLMDKEKEAAIILKALAYTENGGKPGQSKAGKSGEMKSIFQFLPSTWALYSKQTLGQEVPLTPESEMEVVHKKVSDWLDHGFTREQIASMWNAGERKPDAYKQGHKGTNKFGVNYDTPSYAKKVATYAKQFEKEPGPGEEQQMPETAISTLPTVTKTPEVAMAPTTPGLIKKFDTTTI